MIEPSTTESSIRIAYVIQTFSTVLALVAHRADTCSLCAGSVATTLRIDTLIYRNVTLRSFPSAVAGTGAFIILAITTAEDRTGSWEKGKQREGRRGVGREGGGVSLHLYVNPEISTHEYFLPSFDLFRHRTDEPTCLKHGIAHRMHPECQDYIYMRNLKGIMHTTNPIQRIKVNSILKVLWSVSTRLQRISPSRTLNMLSVMLMRSFTFALTFSLNQTD